MEWAEAPRSFGPKLTFYGYEFHSLIVSFSYIANKINKKLYPYLQKTKSIKQKETLILAPKVTIIYVNVRPRPKLLENLKYRSMFKFRWRESFLLFPFPLWFLISPQNWQKVIRIGIFFLSLFPSTTYFNYFYSSKFRLTFSTWPQVEVNFLIKFGRVIK